MDLVLFDSHVYDQQAFEAANHAHGHRLTFLPVRLTRDTVPLAQGAAAVCCFVNDVLSGPVLEALAAAGTRLVALRCAGFDNVDLEAAEALGLAVVRVPAYSPHAVAEHAVALLLTLNRQTHRANARVREGNFSLDGLVGFDLHGKTIGVVGTGRIGRCFIEIMRGFGCRVVANDPKPDPALAHLQGVSYVPLDVLLAEADVISLHAPLTDATRHLIDARAFSLMKPGAFLLNTSRGSLVDSAALVDALKQGHLGGVGLDVYEREAGIFFKDWSETGVQDDVLARLLTFPQVLVTGHQAFLTHTALGNIAETTLHNVDAFERGQPLENLVTAGAARPPRV
ncbi:MAG: 2-hydroxyacid dehydrogenase [Candidatus Sericytochromatia bacterium]|nr:2-hydroxyacid dehydrogenase [Candidatus Sericytochromatia bacterium]